MQFIKYYLIAAAAILSIAIFGSYKTTGKQQVETEKTPQSIEAIQVPDYIEFAGEAVPLDNADAYERLDFQLQLNTFRPHFMIRNIKLAARYFPTIEKVLKEEGVPDDFKYLAVAESSLLNATSRSGAQGIWQFMPSTGKAFGLEVNSEVDERANFELATRAACEHLKADFKRFGSWTMAAAAYNTGAGRLRKNITEQQVDNYYELELREETANYMFRILSIKEIMQRREKYGINVTNYYQPLDNFRIVEVDGAIYNLAAFAIENGTNLKNLRLYNPWLISDRLTNRTRKTYQIKIPK